MNNNDRLVEIFEKLIINFYDLEQDDLQNIYKKKQKKRNDKMNNKFVQKKIDDYVNKSENDLKSKSYAKIINLYLQKSKSNKASYHDILVYVKKIKGLDYRQSTFRTTIKRMVNSKKILLYQNFYHLVKNK